MGVRTEYLLTRYEILPSGCWQWLGSIDSGGYGKYSGHTAHRVVYEVLVGPIPVGLELDHLCRNTACVNPKHLEPVTHAENKRRRYAIYTSCKNGHDYTPENTYVMPTGWRDCRVCIRDRARRYKTRLRGAS